MLAFRLDLDHFYVSESTWGVFVAKNEDSQMAIDRTIAKCR